MAKTGVGPLCRLFGKTRQAHYQKLLYFREQAANSMLVLDLVAALRREIPGLGTKKLYLLLQNSFRKSGIKMGRDKLHKLLQTHNLTIRVTRKLPKTTNSNHWMKKYPNLIKELEVTTTEQVWVCDLTYVCVGKDFNYLSLITDAHSRMIIGYFLHQFLSADGCIKALDMAISSRNKTGLSVIHHSDRGSQYCSFQYVQKLKEANIEISMTDNGDPYENAMAERVNGILKTDFKLNRIFKNHMEALLAVEISINNYNQLRPHMSCNYMTPFEAHCLDEPLIKRWKSNKSKQSAAPPASPVWVREAGGAEQ
ncbi:MAG: IS3 family transposase [Chitinophagaceae bacterium]|nr:IS3 family transposase [Chitinophagaceae bacterium]